MSWASKFFRNLLPSDANSPKDLAKKLLPKFKKKLPSIAASINKLIDFPVLTEEQELVYIQRILEIGYAELDKLVAKGE